MSSAIATYTGRLTPQQRANDAWGLAELPAGEQARHERLIQATRRIDPKPDAAYEQAAIEARVRSHHWRHRQHEHQNDVRRDGCDFCHGTGQVTVSDGCGGVDFDACPKCQEAYAVAYGVGSVENF